MRYGIFSDIHANLEALESVLAAYQDQNIDCYLCGGDIVGYAADPNQCCQLVEQHAQNSVAGNHDYGCIGAVSMDYFNQVAKEAVIWTKSHLDKKNSSYLKSLPLVFKNKDLTLAHATLDEPGDFNYLFDGFTAWKNFRIQDTPVCFVGHTHVPGVFVYKNKKDIEYLKQDEIVISKRNRYIVNVGSVGQPRDGNPLACYCIYDSTKARVLIKRAKYNIKKAKKKIIQAGLPRFLAERLGAGS